MSTVDNECEETRHGSYSVESKRYQLVFELALYEDIKARAKRDHVKDADVVRTAVAVYLGWPADYRHPR